VQASRWRGLHKGLAKPHQTVRQNTTSDKSNVLLWCKVNQVLYFLNFEEIEVLDRGLDPK
jgi:hypothetical protein